MNFANFLVKDAFERSALKLAVIALSMTSIAFSLLLALDLSKEPILIERACETRLLEAASSTQTADELYAFVREAAALRFDVKPVRDPASFLSQDLLVSREKEQGELKRSGIDQRLIVRSVKMDGDRYLIEADRLVAVGKARSAIPILLTAKIASKSRNLANPYGLVLTQIDPVKVDSKNE